MCGAVCVCAGMCTNGVVCGYVYVKKCGCVDVYIIIRDAVRGYVSIMHVAVCVYKC